MTIADAIVVGLLAAWFALTLTVQIPHRFAKRPRALDPTGHLLPGWNFFSPKPIQADFEVWYRSWPSTRLTGSPAGSWTLLEGSDERRALHALINPRRRSKKAIFQCCNRISIGKRAGRGPRELMLGVPYLLLLRAISYRCAGAGAVQFRVVAVRRRPTGEQRTWTIFTSEIHRVAAARQAA